MRVCGGPACRAGLQQPGPVPRPVGGEGRGRGEEERQPADCGLAQLDTRVPRNVGAHLVMVVTTTGLVAQLDFK